MKNTKKSLLFSVLALVLSVAMLLSTTFAWFTDNASTAVNKIEAGKLDIQLLDASGNSLEGRTLTWQKAAGHEAEPVLWEPGCTYNLQPITIKNNGNLALKYKIAITGINGDAELNNVIDWTISDANLNTDHSLAAGASATLTISGHMQETAGNEYQGLSIDGISITVVATQDTVEYDSTNNTYDHGAQYDTVIVSASELSNIMTPDSNGVINLEKNYIVNSSWTPLTFSTVTINGNGHTITGLSKPLVKTATNITINDLSIISSDITPSFENGLGTGAFVHYLDTTTVATFKNCHLINSSVTGNERAAGIVSYSSGASLVIENCTVENCKIKSVGGAGGLVAYSTAATTIKNSSVKDTTVTATEDRLGTKTPLAGGVIGTIGGATTFTNVTVTNVTVTNNNASTGVYSDQIGRIAGSGTITIN